MKIHVIRKDNTERDVTILYDRATDAWAFVNLTSGHICSCRFESFMEALCDLVENENVIRFTYEK